MKTVIHLFCPIFTFFIILCFGEQYQQLSWSPTDLFKLKSIKDVRMSPNGHSVLFVVTETTLINNKWVYVSKIYKKDLSHANYQVIGPDNCSNIRPRWSNNGKWIAFLSDRSGGYRLHLMNDQGENIQELFQSTQNIQTFKWSPDNTKIAFVMTDEKKISSTPSKYGLNIYKKPESINRLWMIDLMHREPQPISCTPDEYCVKGTGEYGTVNEEFDWSPDGKWIIFAYSPSMSPDDFYLDSSLAIMDVQTLNITPLINQSQHESMPKYSLDGRWIAYLASNPPSYAFNKSLMIRSMDGRTIRQLASTFNGGPFFAGPSLLGWTQDNTQLLYFEPKGTRYHLLSLPVDGGKPKEIFIKDCLINEPALSYDGKSVGFIAQSPKNPPEAFITNLNAIQPLQISQINSHLQHVPSITTEVINWKSVDGVPIQGLLTYPSNYQKGKAYPLILMIHGGPMGFFDETFVGTPSIYAVSTLAQEGFMILRPNSRGSNGYGEKFRCMNYGDWGGKDAEDLLSGIDELIKKGMVNPGKLGVFGWSYGGYMTARLITLTNRFKAAVMGAGIGNLISFSGTSDLRRLASAYLGEFWQNSRIYVDRSPLFSAYKVTTPCLILHGDADDRVPTSQAFEFYQALSKMDKPVKLILYPGMGHGCHDPQMLMDIMQENVNWFKTHLLY